MPEHDSLSAPGLCQRSCEDPQAQVLRSMQVPSAARGKQAEELDKPHLKKVWRMLPMWEEASSMERYTNLLSLDPLGFSCAFRGILECRPFLPRREMGLRIGPCRCNHCQQAVLYSHLPS